MAEGLNLSLRPSKELEVIGWGPADQATPGSRPLPLFAPVPQIIDLPSPPAEEDAPFNPWLQSELPEELQGVVFSTDTSTIIELLAELRRQREAARMRKIVHPVTEAAAAWVTPELEHMGARHRETSSRLGRIGRLIGRGLGALSMRKSAAPPSTELAVPEAPKVYDFEALIQSRQQRRQIGR